MNAAYQIMAAKAEAYKWAYEYLQSRMLSLDRVDWAHDCDGEIEARIEHAKTVYIQQED